MIDPSQSKALPYVEAALEKRLSTKAPPEQINKRLFDLCRFMRSELLHAELITEKEFSFLIFDCPLAQGSGSPSPRRLEDYDAIRLRLTTAEGLLRKVADTYDLDGLDVTISNFLKP